MPDNHFVVFIFEFVTVGCHETTVKIVDEKLRQSPHLGTRWPRRMPDVRFLPMAMTYDSYSSCPTSTFFGIGTYRLRKTFCYCSSLV
jgi:hypothetical protein